MRLYILYMNSKMIYMLPFLYRAEKISSIPGGKSLTFKWEKGIPGRYINVEIPGRNRLLTLCEVEVYGYPAPDGENIYDQNLISLALIKINRYFRFSNVVDIPFSNLFKTMNSCETHLWL